MNFIILFDGKEWFVEPLPEGSHPNAILEAHPGCIFLDHANSRYDAAIKIQRDRDRHKVVWT